MEYRIEEDALGKVKVPNEAYYGSETQRAIEAFRISGTPVEAEFIKSYVMIKKAAARANMKAGKLDRKRGDAIVKACDRILSGRYMDQFPVDAFQAGAGTNTNMNVNEVIANVAITILGGKRGNYRIVHPNDHVNMSQSTNDTYPSNMNLAAYLALKRNLLPKLRELERSLFEKARRYNGIIKIGRTHLQEAVPMRLGEEFFAYAGELQRARRMLEANSKQLLELSLGGTAIGTGINAGRAYSRDVINELNRITGEKFFPTRNRFAVTQSREEILAVNDSIKEVAVVLMKVANDLRLLASGPRAGMHELLLPEIMPGSSIMPGKVNPSVPEMLDMVCLEIVGRNETVTQAAAGGQLELNVFMPVIAHNTMYSIRIFANAVEAFRKRCIDGIKPDRAGISRHLDEDLSLATALNQYIGYAKAAEIARKAYRENKTVKQVALEMRILPKKQLDRILDPKREAGE